MTGLSLEEISQFTLKQIGAWLVNSPSFDLQKSTELHQKFIDLSMGKQQGVVLYACLAMLFQLLHHTARKFEVDSKDAAQA